MRVICPWFYAFAVFVMLSACSSDGRPPDRTPPSITLIGDDPQVLAVGVAYVELGATASDNRDGDISGSIVIDSSAVDSSAPGEYTVTYNVSDAAGNAAISVNRTVIYEDQTPPDLTLVGENPQIIEAGTEYTELGASAIDNVDGDLTAAISVDASAVDAMVLGEYSVDYEVSDVAGNSSMASRIVRVEDTTPPQIVLLGDHLQTILAGDPYAELGATASDNIDGVLTDDIVVDAADLDLTTSGTYQVNYEVTDSSGNSASASRTVRVLMTGNWTRILFPDAWYLGGQQWAFTLEDGRVLGISYTIWTFDPDTETVEVVAHLNQSGDTATELLDGRILITGGYHSAAGFDPNEGTDLALIFDPADSSLTEVGPMLQPRRDHSATLLENGQVLIVGGRSSADSNSAHINGAELFDPQTNTFSAAGLLTEARIGHTATRLVDGTVLITGGARNDESVFLSEIYQPADRSFTAAATMPGEGRWLHTANLLANGNVLISSGIPGWRASYDPWDFQASVLYDPADDSFVVVEGPGIQAISHFAVSIPSSPECPGPVLLGTGENGWKSVTTEVMIFDPVIEKFYPTASIPGWRVGPASTVLQDGRIFVVGGGGYFGPSYHVDIFEPQGACN